MSTTAKSSGKSSCAPPLLDDLNGHVLGDGLGYLASVTDKGNVCHQMLSNYQFRAAGRRSLSEAARVPPRRPHGQRVYLFAPLRRPARRSRPKLHDRAGLGRSRGRTPSYQVLRLVPEGSWPRNLITRSVPLPQLGSRNLITRVRPLSQRARGVGAEGGVAAVFNCSQGAIAELGVAAVGREGVERFLGGGSSAVADGGEQVVPAGFAA